MCGVELGCFKVCGGGRTPTVDVRLFSTALPRLSSSLLHIAGAALLANVIVSGTAYAQEPPLKVCTRAFGKWVEARDAKLRRLEARPTLLGLDNTWCTTSPKVVTDLRTMLAGVRHSCVNLQADEQERSDELIGRAATLIDRVQVCAGALEMDPVPTPAQAKAREVPPAKSVFAKPVVATVKPAESRPKPEAKAAEKPAEVSDRKPPEKVATTAVTPSSESKRPAVAEPPKARAATTFSGDEECLVVTRTAAATYSIENKNCPSQKILTAIELRRPGEAVRCFTKSVSGQIAIAGEDGSEPQINFQCMDGANGCAEDALRDMFPECQPG